MSCVYRFFDPDGELLYVGCSSNLGARLQQHSTATRWFHTVHSITVEHHPDRVTALAAEAHAISTERPPHNLRGGERAPRTVRHRPGAIVNGPALTTLRQRSGLSKAELHRLTGIDLSIISRLESGERRGTPAQAKTLAAVLRVPISAILGEVA